MNLLGLIFRHQIEQSRRVVEQLDATAPRPAQIGAATPCRTLNFLKKSGFPANKVMGAGVIDGRNIWADTGNAAALVAEIKKCTQAPIRVQVPL